MPSPTEIRFEARKVSEMKSDLGSESNRLYGQVDNSSTWWQGDVGKQFRMGYNEIRVDLKTLMDKMDKLNSSLMRLSEKVQQADNERKAKAAAEQKLRQLK